MVISLLPGSVCGSDSLLPLVLPEGNAVAVGVGAYPDYFGSNDYAIGALPIARLELGNNRSITLMANELRMNLLNDRSWRMGPVALYRFGRGHVKDALVGRMKPINDTVEIGGHFSYEWHDKEDFRKRLGAGTWALYDAADHHGGSLMGINAYGSYPVAMPVTMLCGVGTTWGSGAYMDTYFGVSRENSILSGLQTYRAGSGFRDVRCWTLGILHLGLNWHLGAMVMYSRMLGDAADSPIVSRRGSESQWVYGTGVLFIW